MDYKSGMLLFELFPRLSRGFDRGPLFEDIAIQKSSSGERVGPEVGAKTESARRRCCGF